MSHTTSPESSSALPEPVAPFAHYRPVRRHGDLLYVSGQVAYADGGFPIRGRLGAEVSTVDGQRAARQCALNLLAQADRELGGLDRIDAVLKVTVFVSSGPDFLDHHLVANGASDTFVEMLGVSGEHARSAVGVARLPMDSPVEVEAVLSITADGPRAVS